MKYDFEVNISNNSTHSSILRRVGKNSRVLEFGPATGYMSKFMKEQLECAVTGIEIDLESAEKARVYCEEMIVADIDGLAWVEKLAGKSFDHIIFADVLEHLKNPGAALQHARTFLKQNGTIITSIPNIAHNAIIMELLVGQFTYRPLGLLDDTHIRFFTKSSIGELLEKVELCPVEWEATYVAPEHTEFAQNYSLFSKTIVDELHNRKDGNVYQYVTVSKRKEDVSPNEQSRALAETKENHPANRYLQVSWQKSVGSEETQSVKIPLKYGSGFQQYDVVITKPERGLLKLIPGNLPSFLQIRSLLLRPIHPDGSKGEAIIGLRLEDRFSALSPGFGTLFLGDTETKNVVIANHNPELFIELGERVNTSESWLLSIDLSISQEVPVEFVVANDQKLMEKNAQIAAVIASSSWRLTAPLRWLNSKLQG